MSVIIFVKHDKTHLFLRRVAVLEEAPLNSEAGGAFGWWERCWGQSEDPRTPVLSPSSIAPCLPAPSLSSLTHRRQHKMAEACLLDASV